MSEREVPSKGVKKSGEVLIVTDTGDIWECPVCHKNFHLLHRAWYKNGKRIKDLKHDFEEIPE